MGNTGKKLGVAALIAAVAVLVAAVAASAGRPVSIPLPLVPLKPNGSFHPESLPAQERVPVRLDLSGKVGGDYGLDAPIQKLVIRLDRSLQLNFDSVPACKDGNLNLNPEQVRETCRSSVVGEGTVVIEFHYPENVPIPVPSDLTLLKGLLPNGKRTLFLHGYPTVPSPKATIATLELRKISRGRYGTEATVSIPEIREGHGYLRSFELTIPKGIGREAEPPSLATMRCRDERVQIGIEAAFGDGSVAHSTIVRPCTPKPPAR